MKILNKILSAAAAVALVAVMMPAQADGLDVDSAIYEDVGNTITVTMNPVKDFDADNVASLTLSSSTGVAVADIDVADVTNNIGDFVVDTTDAGALAADTYTVSFVTVGGDYSAAIVNVGGANEVDITAFVAPTLTFVVNPMTIDLGTLSPIDYSVTPVTVELSYSTNASAGLTVDMNTATGLYSATNDYVIGVNNIATATSFGGSYVYQTTTNPVDTDITGSDTVVPTVAGPMSGAEIVTVNAQSDVLTPAGAYGDTLVFTLTADF